MFDRDDAGSDTGPLEVGDFEMGLGKRFVWCRFVLGSCATISAIVACDRPASNSQSTSTPSISTDRVDEDPCIVIWRQPGTAYGDVPVGLEMAVWRDGTVLMLSGREKAGQQSLLVGTAPASDVKHALTQIAEAGFGRARSRQDILDARRTVIGVRIEDGSTHIVGWSGETLMPGGDVDLSNVDHRKFVLTWRRTRAVIELIIPLQVEWLQSKVGADGSFRGYSLKNPHTCPWRPKEH